MFILFLYESNDFTFFENDQVINNESGKLYWEFAVAKLVFSNISFRFFFYIP